MLLQLLSGHVIRPSRSDWHVQWTRWLVHVINVHFQLFALFVHEWLARVSLQLLELVGRVAHKVQIESIRIESLLLRLIAML